MVINTAHFIAGEIDPAFPIVYMTGVARVKRGHDQERFAGGELTAAGRVTR